MRIRSTVPVPGMSRDEIVAALGAPGAWVRTRAVESVTKDGSGWEVRIAFDTPHRVEVVLRVEATPGGARFELVRGAPSLVAGTVEALDEAVAWDVDLRFPEPLPGPLEAELTRRGPIAWSHALLDQDADTTDEAFG